MFAADKTTRNKSLSVQLSQIVNCRTHCSRDNCRWSIHFRRLSTIVLKDTVIHKKVRYTAVVLCNTIQNTLIINIMVSCSKSFKLNLCIYANLQKSLNISKCFDKNGIVWAVQLPARSAFFRSSLESPLSSCHHGGILPDLRGPERCISRGHQEGVSASYSPMTFPLQSTDTVCDYYWIVSLFYFAKYYVFSAIIWHLLFRNFCFCGGFFSLIQVQEVGPEVASW